MKHVIVSGKTFNHRIELMDLGGRWDSVEKHWYFQYATKQDVEQLKHLVGCSVTVKEPRSAPAPDEIDQALEILSDTIEHGSQDGGNSTKIYGDDRTYFNYFKDKNPIAFFGFSSLSEMVKFVEVIPEEKRHGERNAGWVTNDPQWHGTDSMAHAIKLARNGWREGVQNAARIADMINVEHVTTKRRKYAVAGGSVNVGRMLSGNPVHMVRRAKLPGKRVVTLFVQNTASQLIDAKQLVVRAAICAAISDVMESNGYSCEIVSVTTQATISGKPASQTVVTIKKAGEKLNIEDVAFALGHPSFLRRFKFACVSQCDELQDIWQTQGFPRAAFVSDTNELYVRHLEDNTEGGSLEEIARNMFPLIKPANLPLEIE